MIISNQAYLKIVPLFLFRLFQKAISKERNLNLVTIKRKKQSKRFKNRSSFRSICQQKSITILATAALNIANLPLTYGDTESSLGPVYIIERNELGSRDLAKLQVCSFLQLIVSSVLGISKRVKRWQISDSDYYVLVEGYKTFKLLNTFDLRTSSKFS